ncbi:MAG: nucleotide sugar dehydrogenase [Clostridia bacterium]
MVSVIGLGYIGLPTALMFAKSGVEVMGTDYNVELVQTLNDGKLTFEEDGLDELFQNALANGIKFSNKYHATDVYIVAVPTPYVKESKKIDAKYVISAVEEVLKVCPKDAIICIESTISPGTIDKFVRPIIEQKGFTIGVDVHLVHTPERIIPGNMIFELENNSRTIGCDDKAVGEKIESLYSSFCKSPMIITDIRSAEMSKVVENTFRDINIAFANELAKICRQDDLDVYEIIKIANMHPRVNILSPGPGVGGHCISVDPWFLVGDYPELTNVILKAREVNDAMPKFVLTRIEDIMAENNITDMSKVGLYGLTYKEDVDDTRESPTLQLLEVMEEKNISGVKVFDPFVKTTIVDNQYFDFDTFLNDVEMVVILVSHTEIKENLAKLEGKVLFDTKNISEDGYRL